MVSKPPYDQMAPQLCQFYVPGQPSKKQFVKKNGLVVKKHRPDKRKVPIGPICIGFYSNTNGTNWDFLFIRSVLLVLTRPCAEIHNFFLRNFWVFMERKMGMTGVPFGRTEVSIPFFWSFFWDLSHRHGPVGPSLQGMPEKLDFHVFWHFFTNKSENGWPTWLDFGI